MTTSQIQSALGVLQDEPDNEQAWTDLRTVLGYSRTNHEPRVTGTSMDRGDLASLLEAARRAHEMRREYDAVAQLLEIEVALASGTPQQADLVAELARLRDDILLDDTGALAAYRQLLALRPGDTEAEEAVERTEIKRSKWKDLAQRYFVEAKSANDLAFKSSLLVSAAEIAYRYARPELEARAAKEKAAEDEELGPKTKRKNKKKGPASTRDVAAKPAGEGGGRDPRRDLTEKIIGLLRDALVADPKNRRAAMLLERILGKEERWEELATALETFATDAAKDEKIAALTRLARLYRRKIESSDRATATYERILDLAPAHPEATRVLVDHFTEHAMWEHLVSLYDGQLKGGGVRPGQEVGVALQIAMVNWKMRNKPEAAEPFFERVRKSEPAHPGMLAFFREWCTQRGEQTRLVQILTDAQRAMPDGPERGALAGEIATLAESGSNATKAIEQWRTLLRSQPNNTEAREALKRLYRQTNGHNHLADLLRGDLERIAPDNAAARLPVLREIAELYRETIKSDSALVSVLSQIIALDPSDATAVRELARVYESLGRWRDLLTTQMRLAELEPDTTIKSELYRSVGRRWLDQLSNVQNAVEAYEKLREVDPEDREAFEKLRELYGKRRAYRQLYELYDAETKRLSSPETRDERRALWVEMAKMASDRLDRGADASRLYKAILAEDPEDSASLDALEKQAERDKDWATVADVLERRVQSQDDATARLAILQKLGGVYSDRLQDHAGSLRVWRRVLDLSPGQPKALRIVRESYLAMNDWDGLTGLYATSNDWDGLAEVLSSQADRIVDLQTKIDLSFRVAAIYETKLNAPDRAYRSYERVLSVKPDDQRAATALVPLYEKDEKFARLPALYEVLLSHANDDAVKRVLYTKLAEVTGERLSDKTAAFRYARKAYELAPTSRDALDTLETYARASGEWGGLASAIQTRLTSGSTGVDERRALRMKLAEVSAVHAGRPDDAIDAYRELIEANPEDELAITGLDRLLRSTPDRKDDLRWLFRLRVNRAEGKSAVAILAEWALLEEEAFTDAPKAIAIYQELLGLDPEHPGSLRALGRLLLASGDAVGAADILQRERDLEQGESRVARELDLARLYLGPLRNPRESLAAAKRALAIGPNDAQAIALVEELMPLAETRKEAAILLEEAYAAAGQFDRQSDVLAVLIATAPSKQDRLALHLRLAQVKQNLGDRVGAFDVLSRAALESPAELDLWDQLAVLANKTGRTQQFVETIAQAVPESGPSGLPAHVEMDLAERAATLYDENLGEIDRATPYLERILTQDPGNDRAFLRLKQILTTRERWRDLESLYERMLEATESPERRTDLLAEVAIVAEEITNDAPKAIGYYERILAIEPGHEPAMFALDKLYASHERWQNLADLLRRRLELGGSSAATALKLRLGTLLSVRLGDPKSALDYLEEVVSEDPSDLDARALVEQSLGHPDLRQRAAIILEGVYADREEMRDLVRVLEVRLERMTDEVELRDLLHRVAQLKDERLGEDASAFETYGRLLPLSPGDVEARARFLEISERLGKRDDAATILLAAAEAADAPQPRAEILGDVARIYEETNQVERSEAIHRQVLGLAPEDPSIALPATRALERIYAANDRPKDLVEVLRKQVDLEERGDVRRELLGRLGLLAEDSLKDDAAAITAWKERLADDPIDGEALAALDRLYERGGDHRALVEILRTREQSSDDPEARALLMARAARTLETLGETDEAILAYRAMLDDFGADREVLGALASLYAKAERARDLVDTLEADLGLATETADRIALLTRIGDVRRKDLDETTEAIESYRQALTIDPAAVAAREALEGLLVDEGARAEAAEILRPLYEASGSDEKLLRVLDIQIAQESGLEARLELFARAATVAEGSLKDPAKAFGYTSRGLKESAAEPAIDAWIARAERLAASGEASPVGPSDLVALYRNVAPDVLDEDKQVQLVLRIAELARTKLADAALAKESYRRVLDLRAEETRALEPLEELHEEAGEHELLLEILKRRAELVPYDEKRALLYKQAKVAERDLSDRDRAIGFYEHVLDLGLQTEAVSALERLYDATERWGDLVALHERELDVPETTPERRAALHHGLGRIHARQNEQDRAFEAWGEALAIDPIHPATVASLEEIVAVRAMGDRAHGARAASMLEQVYVTRLDWPKVIGAVEARLEGSQDPDERRELLRRLAKLLEDQQESYRGALEVMAKLLAEDIADETTWAELERLARVANAEDRLADIYATELEKVAADEPATARLAYRTGELLETRGANYVNRALSFYRRAYNFSPEDEQKAFTAIDRLLTSANRPAERVVLYRDALEYRTEVVDRVATLHAIAKIEEAEIGDDDAAIVTFRTIVDTDDTDSAALDSLGRLYTRREKWRELADLLRRRAEQSAMPDEEATWRLALADVLDQRLDETVTAIEELENVLAIESLGPNRIAAVTSLESLLAREEYRPRVLELLRPIYESGDSWQKLVDVSRHRLDVAGTPGEKVEILRETAKLLEERGGDQNRAFDQLREAFVLDPDDGETREEIDRLAAAQARWDDLADTYEAAIDKLDGVGKKELLGALAVLHDKRRDDPRRALAAWERLFNLDESDPHPLDEMDQLATLLSDWPVLVRVLAKRAELTNDDEERASLWRRIGEARRDMLEDQQGAIDAYERALELEPESAWTLDNLIALYEERNDAARLVDLYRRRIELCGEDDADLKHRLLLDAARCYEVGLQDRREAVILLGQALAARPNDPDVMKRLSDLYEAEKMWPELLENLRAEAALRTEPAEKIAATKRIGKLLATELDDHAKALEAFREVLAAGYDEEAASAVRRIGETRDELRLVAAQLLEPVLASAEKFEDLVEALELRLRAETEPDARAATLRQIAKVTEASLRDLVRSEDALLRALAERPADTSLHDEIERIATLDGKDGWTKYADTLTDRAGSIFDAKVTADLFQRLGKVAEAQLGDAPRAAEAYSRAAEQGGDNDAILVALERVHGALGDTKALVDVLERRIAIESDPAAQADLYHRLASLQIDALGDRPQGLATLRLALERVPSHDLAREAVVRLLGDDTLFDEAFETLENVYRSTSRGEDLARLYERRVDRADGGRARTRARLDLARIREKDANDAIGAQRAVEAAVLGDPTDAEALGELSRLATHNLAWREAADALRRALETHEGASSELWARLGAWQRDNVNDAEAAEAAYAKALEGDPENVELVRALEALRRGPGRERDRVATLRRLAKLEGEPEKKRELAKESANIAETTLGDAKLAEDVLRELLAEHEADPWAMAELTRLREAAGDHEEVVTLLLRRAEAETDGAAAVQLKHRAATVAGERLGDRDRAVALFEEILEHDRGDVVAQEKLRALYNELGKFNELARLLVSLIELAPAIERAADVRSALRVELARLQLEKFAVARDAVDTLRAVLEEDPDHEAAALLATIFTREKQYSELADLQTQLVERARTRGDAVLELERLGTLGVTLERDVKDSKRALETYEAILERDANHRDALEAVARLAEERTVWDKADLALGRLLDTASGTQAVALALRLANARQELGNDAGVEDALKRALAAEPTNADVRGRLAVLHERTKNWTELAELLVSDAELIARAEGEGAPPPPTPASSERGATSPPPSPAVAKQVELLRRAANIHLNERKAPVDAVPVLERVTALVPNDRELLLLLGDAYTASHRERDAVVALERIIASFGNKRTKELAVYHHRIGKALASLGDKDAALTQLDTAFKIDPGSVEILRDLGVLALDNNDLERAQKTFRALLLQRLDAQSGITKGEVFSYLGEISMKQGDKAKAVQMLERAVENEPNLARARTMLAELKGA